MSKQVPYPVVIIEKQEEIGRRPSPSDFDHQTRGYICIAFVKCIMMVEAELKEAELSALDSLAEELETLQDDFVEYRMSIGNASTVSINNGAIEYHGG
jgi:hypothetical protein